MTTRTAQRPPSPPRPPRPVGRTTLRLDHSRELLGLLPYQLGFHPRDSAVAVSLRGAGREVGLIARIGLPDVLAAHGPGLLGGMAGHLARDGAGEVVVVVYDDGPDPRDPARGLRVDADARAVRAADRVRAVLGGVAAVTTWLVTRDGYLGLDCRDPGCCPPGGRPVSDLAAGGLVGRMVARHDSVLESREQLGEIALAGAGPRRSASAARARWLDVRLRAVHPPEVQGWRQHSLAAWRDVLAAMLEAGPQEDPELSPAQLGRIEAALDDRAVRDAVVLTLVDPATVLADDLLRCAPDGLGPGDGRDGAAGRGPGTRDEAHDDPGGDRWHDDGDVLDGVVDEAGWVADEDARLGCRAQDRRCAVRVASGAPGDPGRGVACPGCPDELDGEEVDEEVDAGEADAGDDARGRPDRDVSEAVRRMLGTLVDPDRAREPREDVVAAARAVLEGVVAHGRQERQAPALTLLALLSWWSGDAVRACVLVERALSDDPGHRLAEILDRALGAGLPPGWVRRRC